MVHPVWDIAFLRVDRKTDRPPAPLLSTKPQRLDGQTVVIGWPHLDLRGEEDVFRAITRNTFGQLMVLPGKQLGLTKQASFSRTLEAVTTLIITGAGAGAPVLDLDANAVAGFTFGSMYLVGSFAVPTWDLWRDPKVVDLGLSFLPAERVIEGRSDDRGSVASAERTAAVR